MSRKNHGAPRDRSVPSSGHRAIRTMSPGRCPASAISPPAVEDTRSGHREIHHARMGSHSRQRPERPYRGGMPTRSRPSGHRVERNSGACSRQRPERLCRGGIPARFRPPGQTPLPGGEGLLSGPIAGLRRRHPHSPLSPRERGFLRDQGILSLRTVRAMPLSPGSPGTGNEGSGKPDVHPSRRRVASRFDFLPQRDTTVPESNRDITRTRLRAGHARQPGGTSPARNASIASSVSPGRSRWGACPQSASQTRVTGPGTPRSIASSCAGVP